MSQGLIIVVVGIVAIWLVLSGKLDCLITAFRACAGSSSSAGSGAGAGGSIGGGVPVVGAGGQVGAGGAGAIISGVVSPNVVN